MEQEQFDHLKGAVEALLFVSEKPVAVDQLKEAIPGSGAADLKKALAVLQEECSVSRRGMTIVEIAGGWQMLSSPNFAEYIREFYKTRHKEKLSRPALETLAIIAYKQPVSRTDIEIVRGVNSDGVVMHLLNKGMIKITGRKEVPGRPYIYGTTTLFLEMFGLRSLSDLPKLEDFPSLMARKNEVAPTVNPAHSPLHQQEASVEGSDIEGAKSILSEEASSTEERSLSEQETEEPFAGADRAENSLAEEMNLARMRMDIEELEKEAEESSVFIDQDNIGEVSGQARLMGEGSDLSSDGQTDVSQGDKE